MLAANGIEHVDVEREARITLLIAYEEWCRASRLASLPMCPRRILLFLAALPPELMRFRATFHRLRDMIDAASGSVPTSANIDSSWQRTFDQLEAASDEPDAIVPREVVTCSSDSSMSELSEESAGEEPIELLERSARRRQPPRVYSPGVDGQTYKRRRLTARSPSPPPRISGKSVDAATMLELLAVPLINRRVSLDLDADLAIAIPTSLEDLVTSSRSIVATLSARPRSGMSGDGARLIAAAASVPRTEQIAQALCRVIVSQGPASQWAVATLRRYHHGTISLGICPYPINDLLVAVHLARHIDLRLNRLADPRFASGHLQAIQLLLDLCAQATAALLPRSPIAPTSCYALLKDISSRTLE